MRSKKIVILIIALFVVIGGIIYSTADSKPIYSQTVDEKVFGKIRVDISGAVLSPGVYALNFDSRVEDAVVAAGGYADDAALEYVNKADFLMDGEFLYIPNKNEGLDEIYLKMNKNINLEENPDYVININEAGVYKLTMIPGIGEKTAEKIIAYRDEHGRFFSTEELLEVSGIGEATLEKIQDYITLD